MVNLLTTSNQKKFNQLESEHQKIINKDFYKDYHGYSRKNDGIYVPSHTYRLYKYQNNKDNPVIIKATVIYYPNGLFSSKYWTVSCDSYEMLFGEVDSNRYAIFSPLYLEKIKYPGEIFYIKCDNSHFDNPADFNFSLLIKEIE